MHNLYAIFVKFCDIYKLVSECYLDWDMANRFIDLCFVWKGCMFYYLRLCCGGDRFELWEFFRV